MFFICLTSIWSIARHLIKKGCFVGSKPGGKHVAFSLLGTILHTNEKRFQNTTANIFQKQFKTFSKCNFKHSLAKKCFNLTDPVLWKIYDLLQQTRVQKNLVIFSFQLGVALTLTKIRNNARNNTCQRGRISLLSLLAKLTMHRKKQWQKQHTS